MKNIYLILISLILLNSCDRIGVQSDDRLVIANNSTQKLYVIKTEFDSISNNLNIGSCSVESSTHNFEANSRKPYYMRGKNGKQNLKKVHQVSSFFMYMIII